MVPFTKIAELNTKLDAKEAEVNELKAELIKLKTYYSRLSIFFVTRISANLAIG